MISTKSFSTHKKDSKKGKVFVALSGGVDSSTACALLKAKGLDVVAVFIKGWYPEEFPCDWQSEHRDAIRVCAVLEIPLLIFDFETQYKKEVIDTVIREFNEGKTPNPDVLCNQYIKFGVFFEKAISMGADFIATGHHVQVENKNNKVTLHMGHDKEKDQSYFLWTIKQEVLQKTLFPIGKYTKSEVRKIAAKYKLPTAQKKDSQGLCFVGKIDFTEFIGKYVDHKKGDILNTKGVKMGTHKGAKLLTFGQRPGEGVSNVEINKEVNYVVARDIEKNTITVATKSEESKFSKSDAFIESINWIESIPSAGKRYSVRARIRYRQTLQDCTFTVSGDTEHLLIHFNTPQRALSSGQSLVLYDGTLCLGGGIIV